jgi:hypothetical protein
MHNQILPTFSIFQRFQAFEEPPHSSPPISTSTTRKMYATTTQGPRLIPLPPTPVPLPTMIPLPNSNTRTVASTCWGTPDYVPRTPSPQAPWRPTTADIASDRGLAAEHSVSPSGHGVTSIPNRVRVSHTGPVGTAEDLLSQTTKSRYHVMSQVIQITCEIT